NRAVFHFGRRITLGVYVRDFLQLERTLKGNGEIIAASEVQEVGNVLELFSDDFDFFVELQDVFNFIGNLLQIGQQRLEQLLRQCSSFLRYKQADHVKVGELSGEYLDACYVVFLPHVSSDTRLQ